MKLVGATDVSVMVNILENIVKASIRVWAVHVRMVVAVLIMTVAILVDVQIITQAWTVKSTSHAH